MYFHEPDHSIHLMEEVFREVIFTLSGAQIPYIKGSESDDLFFYFKAAMILLRNNSELRLQF